MKKVMRRAVLALENIALSLSDISHSLDQYLNKKPVRDYFGISIPSRPIDYGGVQCSSGALAGDSSSIRHDTECDIGDSDCELEAYVDDDLT